MLLYIDTEHSDLYQSHKPAYIGDAGIDLFFPNDIEVPAKSTKLIDFEIRCKMTDDSGSAVSYYLYPRSSISKTPLRMSNSVGIIDSTYRHNIKASVDNISDEDFIIKKGTKLFQICDPLLRVIKVECGNVASSDRGVGFGSSGH
jgi:dUTP pyrophosphatase